jgi:hypothetical protein
MTDRRPFLALCGACALALAAPCAVGELFAAPDPADLQRLEAASLPADGAGLMEFLRKQVLKDVDRARVEALVRRLGDDAYAVREKATKDLVVCGPGARPLLRAALRSADREVARRAEHCLMQIERATDPEVVGAAVRVLASRKPPGAAAALLDFLPAAEDPRLAAEVGEALSAVAAHGGKADLAVVRGLEDRDPIRRGAAGEALCRANLPEMLPAVRKLLRDAEPLVRRQAALALAEARENEAVPVLVALVAELPRPAAERVEETLYLLAGDDVPPGCDDEDAARRHAAWEGWWAAHGRTLDLRRTGRPTRSLGYTLIAQLSLQGEGEVLETDATGRVRWRRKGLHHPIDVQLLNGDRFLVAEHESRTVTEKTLEGKVLWQRTVPGVLLGARRLESGRTFVVTRDRVFEVDAEGGESHAVDRPSADVAAACRLRDGQTVLVTTNGQCLRIDAEGREVKGFPVGVVMSVGSHIDVSPAGHVLVPLYSRNQVVEYDGAGKPVWSASVARPSSVQRLPSGHLLVGSRPARAIVEIDRRGEEVWRQRSTGYPLFAWRR